MRVEADRDFGTRECPSCATEVPKNNNHCPICGYEFPAVPPPRGLSAIIGLIIFGFVIASILLMLVFGR